MSLHDPARRPWGSAWGARIISSSAWALVAATALLSAFWWVGMLGGDETLMAPSIVAFNVSIVLGIGAIFVDLGTASRRSAEESGAIARLPGAWFTGAGVGAIAAIVFIGGRSLGLLPWGVLMLAGGALLFLSPVLLAQYRTRGAQHHERVRASGLQTQATVTTVRTFFREHVAHHRVTMRFTDQIGSQRWFTQTAPAIARPVEEGAKLVLHYDPDDPGRRRSLVVDWPSWE